MTYSNSIVSIMLGWLRGIANWAVNLFNTSGAGRLAVLTWFSQHWLPVLLVLIAIGLVMDWLIWMIRWRPYWVWFRQKRILIDDTQEPAPRRRPDDNWDGLEDDERAEEMRRRRVQHRTYQRRDPDFFSVAPEAQVDAFADENSFRPKAHADVAEDPFTISSDDPDSINFWQEDVFNVTDINQPKRRRQKPARR